MVLNFTKAGTTAFNPNQVAGMTTNNTYSIRVQAGYGSSFGPLGNSCNLTIGTVGARLMNNDETENQDAMKNITDEIKLSQLVKPVKINLYPNPASEIVNINLSEPVDGNFNIMDVSGRLVKSFNAIGDTISVSTEELANGTYFLILNSKIGTTQVKFNVIK